MIKKQKNKANSLQNEHRIHKIYGKGMMDADTEQSKALYCNPNSQFSVSPNSSFSSQHTARSRSIPCFR